jgi:hypothetical protein
MIPSRRPPLFLALAVLVLSSGLLGCGGSKGPERFRVSGKVTFKGQPVPVGTIRFDPDPSKGNQGPQGSATIEDGRYDTAQGGHGVVGGPHVVRISGFDGIATSDDAPQGTPLFPAYKTQVDLPKGPAEHDFEVPAPAGR